MWKTVSFSTHSESEITIHLLRFNLVQSHKYNAPRERIEYLNNNLENKLASHYTTTKSTGKSFHSDIDSRKRVLNYDFLKRATGSSVTGSWDIILNTTKTLNIFFFVLFLFVVFSFFFSSFLLTFPFCSLFISSL